MCPHEVYCMASCDAYRGPPDLTAARQGYARPAGCPMMVTRVISLLSDNRTECREGSLGAAAPTSGDGAEAIRPRWDGRAQ